MVMNFGAKNRWSECSVAICNDYRMEKRNLAVFIGSDLSLNNHIKPITKSTYYKSG